MRAAASTWRELGVDEDAGDDARVGELRDGVAQLRFLRRRCRVRLRS